MRKEEDLKESLNNIENYCRRPKAMSFNRDWTSGRGSQSLKTLDRLSITWHYPLSKKSKLRRV